MVKANDFGHFPQHSTWHLPNLNGMSLSLEPVLPEYLPACIDRGTCMVSTNVAFPGSSIPGIPNLKAEQTNEAHGLLQCLAPGFQALVPAINPYLKEKPSVFSDGINGNINPNAISGAFHKGLLIFDQSGNQTRLIYSSVCPPTQNPNTTMAKVVCDYELHEGQHANRLDQLGPMKPILNEESGYNDISGEESEMHEDTEEINALLYSDEDDDTGDDDEVTSTYQSPILIKGNYEKKEQVEELAEEVASSDGTNKRRKLLDGGHNKSEEVASSDGINKRRKLLDGGYNKSSLMDTASSVGSRGFHEYDNDAESSYAVGHMQREEMDSILANRQSRKDTIRETLKILESIIPGVKGKKDPLLVLDEAIDYLKSLKHKANTSGVNYN